MYLLYLLCENGKNCKIYKKINKNYCKMSAIVVVYQVEIFKIYILR